ncbi:MAG: hypothetical protein HOQ19_07675 [Gemmatimonadaceae bacterium]|nr:hypothetical protein [Gemmatimonadaceae bacterium]NUO96037.1 hypothetical protein [Gemmatimonadaceae bacterium]NUP55696.1 hypothetical protein [Gemmatimonadaceae bacterium]NUP72766.1 hypothetical protein [Gemmatimonadaceae bacterium]NUS48599.1 hypothetical protein [Gemmatimonadaceae bacterium]
MRRNYWVVVASALVIGVLTGCSENTVVAPAAASRTAPASTMFAPSARPQLSLSGNSVQNGVTQFTVNASGGTFYVGNHAVYFPGRSICDPATSSYGDGEWDAPCKPLNRPLTITARLSTANGVQAVDFSPSIRFVPSDNPARWVWIFMYTPDARSATDLSKFAILFSPSLGAMPVNDALTDPTLRTYVDTRAGVSYRRIKHFTGYSVGAGFTDTPTDSGTATFSPAP